MNRDIALLIVLILTMIASAFLFWLMWYYRDRGQNITVFFNLRKDMERDFCCVWRNDHLGCLWCFTGIHTLIFLFHIVFFFLVKWLNCEFFEKISVILGIDLFVFHGMQSFIILVTE